VDRVCELNVRAQVQSVCHSPIVRSAWERGQALTIHGWIYRLTEGLLRDLQCARLMQRRPPRAEPATCP